MGPSAVKFFVQPRPEPEPPVTVESEALLLNRRKTEALESIAESLFDIKMSLSASEAGDQ